MLTIVITVLIYSSILTIATFYKDNSSYFICSSIDVVLAGPVMWISLVLLMLLRPLIEKYRTKRSKEVKLKTDKEIEKIVSKIIKNYKKYKYRDYHMIDLRYSFGDDARTYDGWDILLVKKPRFERINQKFETLMYSKQKEDVTEVIKKYCNLINLEEVDNWYIQDKLSQNKDFKLYKVQYN